MVIKSFLDLDVYQRAHKAAIVAHREVVEKLPESEKYNLKDQSSRASKAICPIIAEGYARKHHPKDWQKYIDQAIGEANEMIAHLSLTKEIYLSYVKPEVCERLLEEYNIIGKQLFKLGQAWNKKPSHLSPTPPDSPPISHPHFRSLMFLTGPLALSLPGFGQVQTPPNIPSGASSPTDIINLGLSLITILVIVAALIFTLYGGILWITSQGDKGKIDRARRTITYSIVGLVIMILAFVIVQIVGTLLGVSYFSNFGK